MANSKWFHSKLTGAKARLFAHSCKNYSKAAENACDDTLVDYPIFSSLSPHQRLQLVREVMVGLLCPGEPPPPETIQHYTTFQALVEFIWIQIGVEIVDFKDVKSISDDLRDFCDEAADDRKTRTPEEMDALVSTALSREPDRMERHKRCTAHHKMLHIHGELEQAASLLKIHCGELGVPLHSVDPHEVMEPAETNHPKYFGRLGRPRVYEL
jgi:hypothetical protein